jgi:hypothetical protein
VQKVIKTEKTKRIKIGNKIMQLSYFSWGNGWNLIQELNKTNRWTSSEYQTKDFISIKYLENLLNKNEGRIFFQQKNKNNKDDKRKINKTAKSSF